MGDDGGCIMSAVSCSSSASSSSPAPPAVAAHEFLTSFDLLTHSCTLLSLTDLLTLTLVSRFLHSVADSDHVWRPRLQTAIRARHTKPDIDSDEQMPADSSEQKTGDSTASSSSSSAADEPMTVCACSQQQWADSSASCKTQYLNQFQCAYHTATQCRRLIVPNPLLLVNRGPRGGMVAMMRARRSSGHSVNVSAGELHCVQTICQQCLQSLAMAVKNFYDIRSEWAGSFTMTPLSVVPVPRSMVEGLESEAAVVVDVRYWHVGGYEDVDHRRFTVEWPQHQQQQKLTQPTTTTAPLPNDTASTSPPQSQHAKSRESEEEKLQQRSLAVNAGVRSASDSGRTAASACTSSPTNDSSVTSDTESQPDNNCHVLSMAPFCSGKWAFHSPANVVVTDALRFSRLARAQQPRQRNIPARVIGPFAAMVPSRRARNGQSV